MVDLVEEAGDVCFHHHPPPRPGLVHDRVQRVVRRTLRSEPEAARCEIRLENRLEHDLQRGLHHPVTNRRDAQRPGPPVRLGDLHPPHRRGTPTPLGQLGGEIIEERDHHGFLDRGDGDAIDTSGTAIAGHIHPGPPQHVPAMDLVVERMEPSVGRSLGCPVERALKLNDLVSGGHSPAGTHRPVPPTTRMHDAGALRSGRVMLSRPSALLRPPPTPSRHRPTSRRRHRL